ncbi:monofunctional biosynthetic peptidoglycan transglycosylase [Nitrosomonas eutropha]|uniref:monofunctional biosynthetic peptidoglycan transglycosylase n=1 Tax=Nitrosomonas TaxID=914 RepID=UPI00089A3D21|nr:monofunctional biosynthetic peptidoglycan transglycosylase [Nitrosomonas eutropha]MXS79663.1 monofunctional biosynthetic peptidoglycan transglycosylase [Nitrosomonas sp. GH22]SDW24060.1 monofunctional biosynthetic peptidoglycan transglycosylase [Nitrosomonas eutropha]
MKLTKTSRPTTPQPGLISTWLLRPLLLLLTIALLYQSWFLLHIIYWRTYHPTTSAFMQDRLETMHRQNPAAKLQYRWVDYEQISNHLKRAVIATEDARFMQHQGFDYKAIEVAWKKNLKQRKLAAGGSTISQQLAKNLFLSSEKTVWRKLQETLITLILEEFLSKRRILEIYLNVIEWGEGVFGIEAAARHYFGIPASSLAPEQSAWLASIISNPRFYDTHRQSPRLLKKARIILSRLPTAKIP